MVSIPLLSGLHVINFTQETIEKWGFNPLIIGSTCNVTYFIKGDTMSFNPLIIGSTCNVIRNH